MNSQEIRRRNKTYEEAIATLEKIKIYCGKDIEMKTGEITRITYNDYLLSRHETMDKVKDILGDNFLVDNDHNHGLVHITLKK